MHNDNHIPSPRLDGRQAVRLALTHACTIIADHATGMVPTGDDKNLTGLDVLDHALHQRSAATELLHLAITEARMRDNTSWEDIAARLGLTVAQAVDQFGHCDLNHLAQIDGAAGAWPVLTETCPALIPDGCAKNGPAHVAREADIWYLARTSHPGDPYATPNPKPVTAGL